MILKRILLAGGVCLRHTCMPCENSISLEAFFSGHKTANEMFQGSPELLFGCKIEIYA